MAKRIVFIVGSLAVGGAESQLVLLAEQLAKRGWEVDVFALEARGPLLGRLGAANINVIDGGCRFKSGSKLNRVIAVIGSEIRLLGHLYCRRPSIIHGFLPLTNFFAAISGKVAFVPMIVTSKRALGTHQDVRPIFRRLDRIANRLSHMITGNSRAVAADVEKRDGYPADKVVVIPNGIDLSRKWNGRLGRREMRARLGLEGDDVAVVKVANLIPYKGHTELLDAIAVVARKHHRVRLLLVGEDRGIGAQLERRSEELGVADRVRFLGRRADVPAILAAMDIGVMASHEEGSSNALIEKLAAGLPVVATAVGGNPEEIEGMPGCVLVKPRDSADLARGIMQIIEANPSPGDAEARVALIRERHSIDAMVDAYERLYASGTDDSTQ